MIRSVLSVLATLTLLVVSTATGTRTETNTTALEKISASSSEPRSESNRTDSRLAVLFTSETRANLVPCTCPDGPWGGIARRVGYLSGRKAALGTSVLSLDGGGFLPVGTVPLRNDPQAETDLIRLLTESLLRSNLDVVTLDPGDSIYLRQIVPDLWPRIEARSLDASVPSPARIVSWNGTPVAVLALHETLDDEAISAAAQAARTEAEVLIVLARADGVSGRRIATLTQADLVVLSFGVRTEKPVRYENCWIVGAGREGKEVGELFLTREDGEIAIEDYRLVPMDETVIPHPATETIVRTLLDEFGPGWRMLVTPVE
ncbi:MAG: hypothetical protein R3E97_07990 [Candidatus Eisenbacteria bacterium]